MRVRPHGRLCTKIVHWLSRKRGATGRCPYCRQPIYTTFCEHCDGCGAFKASLPCCEED